MQRQDNTTIAIALAQYHRAHGSYPAELAGLAPKYLPAVPLDRFSGKALIYRPAGNGFLLYSVGRNGVDDKGHEWMEGFEGDDLSVRVPSPRPLAK